MASELRINGPGIVETIVGLPRFWRDEVHELRALHAKYGDVCEVGLAGIRNLILCHPDAIEGVLLKHAKHFTKDYQTAELSDFLGQGLLTSEHEHWKRHRRMAAPFLTRKHIRSYADDVTERTAQMIELMVQETQDKGQTDLHQGMMRLTLDIVLDTLFGVDIDPEDYHVIHHGVTMAMEYFDLKNHTYRRFLPMRTPGPNRLRYRQAMNALDEVLYRLIDQKRKTLNEDDNDLLSRLILAVDGDQQLSNAELRDEAMTMVVAGHETTALACLYAILLLHDRNRDFLAALRETEGTVSKDVNTYLDGELDHSKALVKESMRYIPPAWVVGREAQSDVQMDGFVITKGMQVYMPQCVVHRDERWFDDPETFLPERWLDPDFETNLPRFAYFPFGGGPRTCIGNHFALMEATLILAKLLDETEIEVATHFDDLAFTPSITLRPAQPVWVSVHTRN